MTSSKLFLTAAIAMAVNTAQSATILDPALASGSGDVIDPTGSEGVDQSFGTSQATLEARSDLRVLQSFAGFTAGNNIVSFTDTALPDIQFALTGNAGATTAGLEITNSTFSTSGSSAYRMAGDGTDDSTFTLTISFGTWNGSSFTGDRTVAASAFALTQLFGTTNGTVTFRDSSGTAITGASFAYTNQNDGDAVGNHGDSYFGWDSDSQSTAAIGSIVITRNSDETFSSGFDDLAFTAVPEPSVALLGGLGLLVLLRRRRF